MNLIALRQKVKNITDYSPELQQFNDQLDDLLNDAYYALWSMKRWNFATKIDFIDFLPDITSDTDTEFSAGAAVTLSVTNGDRRVVLSHSIGRLDYVDNWEGSPIEINSNEYIISKIINNQQILLTTAFEGDTAAALTTWKIKKRYYQLPEDCAELLYLGHRDYPYNNNSGAYPPYGKATAILPRHDESYGLRVDYDNVYAEAYIPSPTIPIQAAETLSIATTSGSLSTGYYELCWAFVKDGKLSPLSEPKTVQITTDSGGLNVTFLSWDGNTIFADSYQSNDQKASQWEGYRKAIFWNKNFDSTTGERLGLPCWLQVTIGGTTRNTDTYLDRIIAQDTATTQTINHPTQLDNGSKRYIEIDGTHQTIRPYPRVNGFDEKKVIAAKETVYIKQGVMRYFKKPKDMLLGTDSPQMPYEFHQLIVYKALEEIYLKLGAQGLAQTYERKYTKEIKQLEKRYVDKIDFLVQRGQLGFYPGRIGYTSNDLRYLG